MSSDRCHSCCHTVPGLWNTRSERTRKKASLHVEKVGFEHLSSWAQKYHWPKIQKYSRKQGIVPGGTDEA